MKKFQVLIVLLSITSSLMGQHSVEGYVFETENRGYLNMAKISFLDRTTRTPVGSVFSDSVGFFKYELSAPGNYYAFVEKRNFKVKEVPFKIEAEKTFVQVELEREPGYQFEATLAPVRSSENVVVDAIKGARIEVFNNTKDEQQLELLEHPDPEFGFSLKEGNHYTLMIRKKGYLTKRIEAYVNVEGCILCLDGVGEIRPGVADNLHEGNELGVLLANIELEPVAVGTKFVVENIYYDFDKSYIRNDAAKELNNLAIVLRDNPKLIVELGSHTDSRGKDGYNMRLSKERASSAVNYLIQQGVYAERIAAKGYGETEILNNCANGVECEEEDHQMNRRTEIKVTGMLAFDELEKKTLAQIIREEKFLAEAFGGGQIEIKEGEIPADLEKFLEENAEDLSKSEREDMKDRVQGQRSLYEELPDNFSGYTILLTKEVGMLRKLRSSVQLDDTIYEYVEGKEKYYLLGEHRKIKSAKKQIDKLQTALPSAEIVFFKKGKMIKK